MRGLAVGGGLLGLVLAIGIVAWLAFGGQTTGGGSTPGVVQTALDARQHAEVEMAMVQIRARIQQYQAVNGKYPAALEELAKEGALPKLPPGMQYRYDSATGDLSAQE